MLKLNQLNFSRKAKKIFIFVFIILALLSYCSYLALRSDPVSYMTVSLAVRDINKKVFATGTIAGQTQVDVGAQVSGQILKLYVSTGDEVKQGQLLCEIDPKIQETALKSAKAQITMIEAQITSKKAEIKKLKLEYDRQKRLVLANATSKQDAEVAEAAYDMALASLKELQAQKEKAQLSLDDANTNLGYTKIKAPMDGTVYATVVSEGQTVNANQTTPTILRLATLDHMKVKTEISEADVVNVKPGMECTFTILGLPYRNFKGRLERIDPAPATYESASASSSSSSSSASTSSTAIYYNSDIIADNFDRTLRIDMTADVTIEVASKKGVKTLPLTALRSMEENECSVYILEEDKVVEKKIKTGLKDDQYIEVISGISDTDRVVIGDDVKTAQEAAMKNDRRRKGPF
ncbi:MAG: efflux RND transporter periplasmic adaptor subunit [Succinivibrio sp.]